MAAKYPPNSLIAQKPDNGSSGSDISDMEEWKQSVIQETTDGTSSNEVSKVRQQTVEKSATCDSSKNIDSNDVPIPEYSTQKQEILIQFLKYLEGGKTEYDTSSVIPSLKSLLKAGERCLRPEEDKRKHSSCSKCAISREKINNLNKQIEDLKCENCKHLSEIDTLNKTPKIAEIKEITGGHNTFAKTIENKYVYDPKKEEERKKKMGKLKEDNKGLTDKVHECQLNLNKFPEMESDLKSKNEKCKELRVKLTELQNTLNKEISQNQRLTEQLNETARKLRERENDISVKDEEIKSLKEDNKKKEDEVKEKCVIIHKLRTKYGDVECTNSLEMESQR